MVLIFQSVKLTTIFNLCHGGDVYAVVVVNILYLSVTFCFLMEKITLHVSVMILLRFDFPKRKSLRLSESKRVTEIKYLCLSKPDI